MAARMFRGDKTPKERSRDIGYVRFVVGHVERWKHHDDRDFARRDPTYRMRVVKCWLCGDYYDTWAITGPYACAACELSLDGEWPTGHVPQPWFDE